MIDESVTMYRIWENIYAKDRSLVRLDLLTVKLISSWPVWPWKHCRFKYCLPANRYHAGPQLPQTEWWSRGWLSCFWLHGKQITCSNKPLAWRLTKTSQEIGVGQIKRGNMDKYPRLSLITECRSKIKHRMKPTIKISNEHVLHKLTLVPRRGQKEQQITHPEWTHSSS